MDTPVDSSTKNAQCFGHLNKNFALHDAIKREDHKTIDFILRNGIKPLDVCIKNSDGKTVVDLAAELKTDRGRMLFIYLRNIRDISNKFTKDSTPVPEASTSGCVSRERDGKGVSTNEGVDSEEELPRLANAWLIGHASETAAGESATGLEDKWLPQESHSVDVKPVPRACGSLMQPLSTTYASRHAYTKQLEQSAKVAYEIAKAKRRVLARRVIKTNTIARDLTKTSQLRIENQSSSQLNEIKEEFSKSDKFGPNVVAQGSAEYYMSLLDKDLDINSTNIYKPTVIEGPSYLDKFETTLQEWTSRKFTQILPNRVTDKYKEQSNTEQTNKRTATREQIFLTKLTSLVFIRASSNVMKENFVLGTINNDIQAFKDLCIRYKQNEEDVVIFLQAIRNYDRCVENISHKELWTTDGVLSIIKYFNSYIKIRNKFYEFNTDLVFDGTYEVLKCYFILYTTLKDDLGERKCITDDKLDTIKTVKDLLSTNDENAKIFQYKHDEWDIDCLTKTFLNERFESIAKSLLELARADNINKIMDYNIKIYHVLLAKKVIETAHSNVGKFRSEFLTSNDESLIVLRKALYRQVVKEKLQNDKINEAIQLILFQPNVCTISKLIGNVIEYNHQSKQLEVVGSAVELVEPKLRECLSELQVSRTTAKRAMETAGIEKLKNVRLNLPEGFGKFTFNLKGANVKDSYSQFAGMLEMLIKGSTSKKIIIDERVVDTNKIRVLEPGYMDISRDIGTALTDLLVLDDDSKSFMFNMNVGTLEPNAQRMLDELQSRIKDLDSYRLQVNFPGYPKMSFDADAREKELAKDFFNNLWFFTGQADDGDIDKIVVKEIYDRKVSLSKNA